MAWLWKQGRPTLLAMVGAVCKSTHPVCKLQHVGLLLPLHLPSPALY
jgi:hypothetical protein